jgi:hypothetical protein
MKFPAPENVKIPEGHYKFRLNREPELKKVRYTKDGIEKEFVKVVIYATGLNEEGEFKIADAFMPFEDRYTELLAALGVEHSKDVDVAGSTFEADIVHEPDKKDPLKSWPRIAHIMTKPDDDIPF